MRLTRTEPEINLHRFYRMEIVRGLFGDWGLVRAWGRIGSDGRVRSDWYDSEADAEAARLALHRQKTKRGYS
jgi:predicted DNA-binding WGR domain protein